MKEGFVLLGHGSKREEANNEIKQMAKIIQESDRVGLYEVGFLSFASPDFTEAVDKLITRGVNKVMVIPIFLTMGNHIAKDIPEILSLQKENHPGIQFILADHLGPDQRIVDIIQERIREVSSLS